jgi:hypothetical protein
MLAAMVSGSYSLTPDQDGCLFIDRDGALFGFILDFLRLGRLPPLPDEGVGFALARETEYF